MFCWFKMIVWSPVLHSSIDDLVSCYEKEILCIFSKKIICPPLQVSTQVIFKQHFILETRVGKGWSGEFWQTIARRERGSGKGGYYANDEEKWRRGLEGGKEGGSSKLPFFMIQPLDDWRSIGCSGKYWYICVEGCTVPWSIASKWTALVPFILVIPPLSATQIHIHGYGDQQNTCMCDGKPNI